VYDETLKSLAQHSHPDISSRAAEKLKWRHSTLHPLQPPEESLEWSKLETYDVENVLGHPLCPFEAMVYFSKSFNEDFRISACLSLTRRLLEHPPNWKVSELARERLSENFSYLLINDPSNTVRAYCARIPIFTLEILEKALKNEDDILVAGRLLQNPARDPNMLINSANDATLNSPFITRILALDHSLPRELRKVLHEKSNDALTRYFHEWYLSKSLD
jgi:hypothetical protein